jgi:hypothetical protein
MFKDMATFVDLNLFDCPVAEIYKAFWAFGELRARTAADLKNSRTFPG